MAKIPVGNYGYGAGTAPVQNTRIGNPGDPVGRALVGLGQQVTQIAEQKDAEQDALARVRATNALSAHEIELAKARQQFDEEVRTGVVPFEQAEAEWSKRSQKLAPMKPPAGLDPEAALRFDEGIKGQRERADLGVRDVVIDARRSAFRAESQKAIDNFELQAAITGNTEEGVARVNAMVTTLRAGGMDEAQAQEIVANSGRRIWTNEALGRINDAGDIGTLQAIDNDLTADDGRYTPHMEPDRRLALSNQVKARIAQIENRQQQDIDRREAKAATAVKGFLDFTMTGIPASPEFVAQTAELVKGTSQEPAFQQALAVQGEVQNVMRLSPAEQRTYVQKVEANLATNGGTPEARSRAIALRTAVDANATMLAEQPLIWSERRTGKPVQPINMAALQSGDASAIGAALSDRMATLGAMRKQYGPEVRMLPLLPQEASLLATTVQRGTPEQQANLFAVLSTSVKDPTAYNAVMAQIAPNDPVAAYAGVLFGSQRRANGTIGAVTVGDKKIDAGDVAGKMLRGRALLNPAASPEGVKGKPFVMPPPKEFDAAFNERTGTAFALFPGASGAAKDSVRAYYAASSAEIGDASGEFDPDRFDEAVKAVLGEPYTNNGTTVFPPWGMPADDFEDKLQSQLELAKRAIPGFGSDDLDDYGLRAVGDGMYMLIDSNGEFVRDITGDALRIKVQ
jgi:hypothetical protein